MIEIEKEFLTILAEFQQQDVLKHLVLVGSWVLPVYRAHYGIPYLPFTTSDIDFSVPYPRAREEISKPNIQQILLQKQYVLRSGLFNQAEKYIPAPGAEGRVLSIEFMCEPGRHIQEPYRVKGLGITVTPLDFQKILLSNIEVLEFHEIPIVVPKPIFWAIHKIAISQLRKGKNARLKMVKDLEGAQVIVNFIGEAEIIAVAKSCTGKFLKLFEKGWFTYREKFLKFPGLENV